MLKRTTDLRLPFDMRSTNENRNQGVHGLETWFTVIGTKGAVHLQITFDVYLPSVSPDNTVSKANKINGGSLGFHSYTPQYEGHTQINCDHLEGGKCYYDATYVRADTMTQEIMSTTGERPEAVLWELLEKEYETTFNK